VDGSAEAEVTTTRADPESDLEGERSQLRDALQRLAGGDFAARLTRRGGVAGDIADAFNAIAQLQSRTQSEVARLAEQVGRLGSHDRRARVPEARGGWRHTVDALNELVDAVAQPTQHLTARLRSLTSEVRRVAHEVAADGRLQTPVSLDGAEGAWHELVDEVNALAKTVTERGATAAHHVATHESGTARRTGLALARAEQELEHERELVDLLQRSFVPSVVPDVPQLDVAARYLAAGPGIVGGDWYDVVPLGDGTALLVIGDVAGHGFDAAAAMAQIRTALRVVALSVQSPSAVLDAVNRYLAASSPSVFATLLVVRCDPGTGECTAASAGHLPPVLCATAPVLQWVRTGPPLGSGMPARYDDTHFTLPVDHTLLLYTDGLVERRGELLDEGIGRLVTVLGACDRASAPLADAVVSGLCPPGEIHDDVALLAVRRRGLTPELDLATEADPARLASTRVAVERWLHAIGLEDDAVADLVLAVSELATNACLHAYPAFSTGPLHVTGRVDGDRVQLVVRDEGRWRYESSSHGGRGIPLLHALGFSVSFEITERGTTARLTATGRFRMSERR
jgi:serine phosphatase RsbU (regulator of sigma subunit)/anti-sigma regulatory factor (Ser/Thr protein kinase)